MKDIRVPVFERKIVAATTVAATKSAFVKLLTALTNTVLDKKRRDRQDMSVKKI